MLLWFADFMPRKYLKKEQIFSKTVSVYFYSDLFSETLGNNT